MPVDTHRLRAAISQTPPPFSLNKIGHVVLMVADLERSIAFYTGVLGFRVSDIYGEDMMPGGMVFMRCNTDHHGVALIGGAAGPENKRGLHHMAFEVGTLDEVFRARDFLRQCGATIDVRRPLPRGRADRGGSFSIPMATISKSIGPHGPDRY